MNNRHVLMTRPSSALRAPSPRKRGEGQSIASVPRPTKWGEGGRRPGEGRVIRAWIAALLLAICTLSLQAQQLKVPDAQQFVGPPRGTPLTGAELDRRTAEIAKLLRCPVCQGLAVADSPAIMALNMKEQVRELLARGYSEEQILSYFERSYGQFVLLKPKFQGVNTLVWLLPVAALLLGAVIVFVKVRKLEAPPPAAAEPTDDPYLARVREMVDQ